MAKPSATIVIPTKNRKDDLRRAILSCLNQTEIGRASCRERV